MPDKVPNMADAFAQYNQIFFSLDFAAMELTAKGLEADQKMPVVRKPAETKAPVAQGANLPVGHTSQILGMAYESELRFVPVGPAGSLNRDEFVTVLFKDGTACYDCQEEFLADPKMTKMRAEDPENFGKWVKRGNHYYITYPNSDDEPDEIEADGIYGPAPKDARYQGAFETSGGVSVGGMDNFTTVVSYETLLLNKDGRFAWSKESAYSGQGTGAAWGGSNAQPAARGRYFIDGFTIRLDYDDGKSETKSFIRFPKELDFLVMEGTAYWIDDD